MFRRKLYFISTGMKFPKIVILFIHLEFEFRLRLSGCQENNHKSTVSGVLIGHFTLSASRSLHPVKEGKANPPNPSGYSLINVWPQGSDSEYPILNLSVYRETHVSSQMFLYLKKYNILMLHSNWRLAQNNSKELVTTVKTNTLNL